MAAITAVSVMRLPGGASSGCDIRVPNALAAIGYLPLLALGRLSAPAGVVLIRSVTLVEEGFRRSEVLAWLRPALDGVT